MKNNFFLTLLFCLPAFFCFAQPDPSRINKQAVQLYNLGMQKAEDGNLPEAIGLMEAAIKKDERYIDAYLSLAGMYGQLKNYAASVATYEKAFALDAGYTSSYRLPYSINLAGNGQFDKALTVINALLADSSINSNTRKAAQYRKGTYQFAVDYARQHQQSKYVFAPQNLGDSINTAESEYFPSVTVDGSQLIFTRRIKNFNEDFFGSRKMNGVWRKAQRLNGSINTPLNEGAQTVSQDGNWLVFTGCNRPDGYGSCDLYISYLTNNGWSEAINLGANINTESWESQPCLSPDKRDLYFASSRPGGYGGSDIYVSHLQANGKWSAPENMGPQINTKGDESAPFIHADNQTLYFTSTGWPGYGNEDLYVVRKQSNGQWSQPENLGYPINTIEHEGSLFIAADGKTAYYASDRSDSRGGLDIYSFELRQDIRPFKTLWVKGLVSDKKTGAGLPSSVELIDIETGQTISKVQTDESGNYLITLPVGKNYVFNVARRGYLFYSDQFLLKEKTPDSVYEKNIALQPIEVNASVVLRNIFFDVNKYELKAASQAELDKIVQLMQDNPTIIIQIEGHTDNAGNAADNQKLSENRAKSVVNYLTGKGIKAQRLVAKGFGASKPVADNKTDAGRAQNRRTELKVIKM